MADSWQRIFERLLVMREISNVLADGDPSRQRQSRNPNNAAVYHYLNQQLEEMPFMRRMLEDLFANPRLLWADMRAYRDHIQKNGHCFDDPSLQEQPKSSTRAVEIRRIGNQLYREKNYTQALRKYNESICFAPNDSEDLAIGYANRSAVFFEQGDFPLALANIALAKKHQYPARLMPKLLTRETNCRQIMAEDDFETDVERFPILAFNLEPNPKIPFLAKGIFVRKLPVHGNTMMAAKEFKVGDVILREKPMKGSVSPVNEYVSCSHCYAENMWHLIPCPNCTSTMYCSEQCLTEAHEIHRFECGVASELGLFNGYWVGPRMFFHGLTLFGNDVKKMMDFCKANYGSGTSFFDVDYSNYDPLEEFKAFIGPKSPAKDLKAVYDNVLQFNSAIMYTMYMKVPLVRSLITGKVKKNFMLQCFFHFMAQMDKISIHQTIQGLLYPIASCFGQLTNPNAVAVSFAGQLKVIVLRPVRRGDRFQVAYGPGCCEEDEPIVRRDCQCELCMKEMIQMGLAQLVSRAGGNRRIAPAHLKTVKRIMEDEDLNNADKLNAMKQFIQRYGALHPHSEVTGVMLIFRVILSVSHENEIKAALSKDFCSKFAF